MEKAQLQSLMAKIVAKAWTDKQYASELKTNPASVLAKEGLKFNTKGVIHVHFDNETTKNIVIPRRPETLNLSEQEIVLLAAQRIDVQLELF